MTDPSPVAWKNDPGDVDLDLALLSSRHPDWKQYERRMLAFSEILKVAEVSGQEYLEILYVLAKHLKAGPGNVG